MEGGGGVDTEMRLTRGGDDITEEKSAAAVADDDDEAAAAAAADTAYFLEGDSALYWARSDASCTSRLE